MSSEKFLINNIIIIRFTFNYNDHFINNESDKSKWKELKKKRITIRL